MSIAKHNPYHPVAAPGEPLAYLYDGTFEGMLTCVYLSVKARELPCDLQTPANLQLRLGQKERTVETDLNAALQVKRSILRSHGSEVFTHLQEAAASDSEDAGMTVFLFTKRLLGQCRACSSCLQKATCNNACQLGHNRKILDELADPLVRRVESLRRHALNEKERMIQFIRFQHLEDDVWFARCNPNANVVPLLMNWFRARFNTQRFVIYDETHKISGIYDGQRCHLVTGDITPPAAQSQDHQVSQAWKRYFDSLCIPERINPELQRQLMPKRLWKNITEMQTELPQQTQATA